MTELPHHTLATETWGELVVGIPIVVASATCLCGHEAEGAGRDEREAEGQARSAIRSHWYAQDPRYTPSRVQRMAG